MIKKTFTLFFSSAANAVKNRAGLSQSQDVNTSSEMDDDPIHLGSDDEPEYILPSVHGLSILSFLLALLEL